MDSPVGRLLSLLFHERKVFPQVDFCVRAAKSVESRNFGLVPQGATLSFYWATGPSWHALACYTGKSGKKKKAFLMTEMSNSTVVQF